MNRGVKLERDLEVVCWHGECLDGNAIKQNKSRWAANA